MVAQVLWYKLMFVNNKCGWCEWVGVDNQRLMLMVGTTSKHTIMRARDALIEAGMIEYRRGKKGKPSMYKLLEITGQNSFGEKNAPYTAPYTAPQTAPIIKQETKTETETNIPPTCPPEGEREKKPTKKHYAEYVTLTEDEHTKLLQKLGEAGTDRVVEILNNYKGANGKRYKSDYMAILNWVIRRYREEAPARKGRYGSEDDFI